MKPKDSLILKKRYNKLLAIENEAGDWLDNNDIPLHIRDEKIPAFRKIIDSLNLILRELKQKGVEATEDEILNGFKIESEVKESG